ncbi:MAG: hypothetical protein A2667_02895 [Candidatus Wildermuthbacteria bacterium RIFCSPHIGHO2_01_FULL_47_27]|uniref:Aspartate/ornithine carbamoyltransferase carbamoyl-P binding domain-containing protein n=2 Tax=Candidatus Wildermuthiibacteriota TaxID=1817923 RepID=A0A1G2RSP4_9BACT|nr:MAG: hypothetical protein A2667_02895 [Candidatus Wildermuthbacteria bacterium RIFCSPHIGHO2_01_FULL_47_27]OHA66947.1 MAG: hypothetical protein A3D59_01840 [Candidatus Wildermuthbacteria bacterium RIFCSPHIGHO2_02_FULL_47_17]OHA75827.1 MAG: hypothetical protein A3A32_02065 [Candidatus Wildermuthbacteria bacterium RIFCSPLOWO2_01_FULL_48_35]
MRIHIAGEPPLENDGLLRLFAIAERIKTVYKFIGGKNYLQEILAGSTIALLCYESGCRVYGGFSLAAKMLGAEVFSHKGMRQVSSVKGEALEDDIRTLAAWPPISAIVLCHPEEEALEKATKITTRLGKNIPIASVGNDSIQAYADVYTLWRHGTERMRSGQLCGVVVGNTQKARVIYSFLTTMSFFHPKLYLVTPDRLPKLVRDSLLKQGTSITQAQRFQEHMAREASFYYLTKTEPQADKVMALARQDAIFLHSGPIRAEMPESVKWDSRFKYDQQIENALWIQAALLKLLLNPEFALDAQRSQK